MARDVTAGDGIVWTCIQAYAGLGNAPDKMEAAQSGATGDRLHVVCTPSGGARSVRLELGRDWEHALADDLLLNEIHGALTQHG